MELFSILGQATPVAEEPKAAAEPPVDVLSFPGDDGGRSLTAMARRDLYVALQLLAERAQYITGASGAAAPELGAHLQVNSGLSGESVRTKKTLRCDNADSDARVNRDSCRTLGIASVVVMPLQKDGEVNGVFELLSERPYAFEERDINALERLGEMIQTAIEHADAAQRADAGFADEIPLISELPALTVAAPKQEGKNYSGEALSTGVEEKTSEAGETQVSSASPSSTPESLPASAPAAVAMPLVHKCSSCGFPVSEGRALCLDCEAKEPAGPLLSDLSGSEPGWLSSHVYLIAAVIIALLTIAVIVLRH